MSLLGTLNVAKTSLAANQLALQTVGNNIANAGNEDYSRQIARLGDATPREVRAGMFVGTGVNVDAIERQIDESVEGRLRASIADAEGNASASQWLSRAEAIYNELSDEDLSTGMSTFFNAWSELANKPQDVGLRQVVVQDGENLARQVKTLRAQFGNLRGDLQARVASYAGQADALATKVADLNRQVALAERGQGGANGLRDQRDAVLKELAKLTNFTVARGANDMVSVYVGSEPLVIGDRSRGIAVRQEADPLGGGDVAQAIVFKDNGGTLPITSGVLGAAKDALATIDGATGGVDALAGSLIFELNKIHAAGQGLQGFASVTSEHAVADLDAALDSADAGLPFKPTNGSFVVHVKDRATGTTSSTLVQIDLDGDGAETSLTSLAGDLSAIDDVTATITAGRLTLKADSPAVEVSFSQDTSGTLAALGVGGFFEGTGGDDIAVRAELKRDPRLLAASRNGQPADNQTAKLIAALQTRPVDALSGQTLSDAYQSQVTGIAAKVAGAKQEADAANVVRDTLKAQRESISGVSLDEEAISLMKFQRAYQASSRVIAATDEMIQTILNLV